MEELLEILNLSQYTVSFKRYGITTCFDVTMLEDEDFEEVQVEREESLGGGGGGKFDASSFS